MEEKKSRFGRFWWLMVLIPALSSGIGSLIFLESSKTSYWIKLGMFFLMIGVFWIISFFLYAKVLDSDRENGISISPFENILLPWPKTAIALAMVLVIELMVAASLSASRFAPCSGLDFVRKANGCLGILNEHSFIETMAFSKDGKTLATSEMDGTIKIWSYPNQTLLMKLRNPWPFAAMSFSSNAEKLAICGTDTPISILETKTGKILHTLLTFNDICQLAFTPDDKLVISVSPSAGLQTWDATTGELLRSVAQDHSAYLAISNDGKLLALKMTGGIINIRRVSDNTLIATLHASHKQFLTNPPIAFSHDGKYLLAVGLDGEIFRKSHKYVSMIDTWNINSGKIDHTITLQDTSITNLASWENSSIFLVHNGPSCGILSMTPLESPCAYLGQTNDGKQLSNLGMSNQIQALAISPTDKKILIGTDNGVYIWQIP